MKYKQSVIALLATFVFYSTSNAQSRLQLSDLYFLGGASLTNTPTLSSWEIDNLEKGLFTPSSLKPSAKNNGNFNSSSRYNTHMGMMAAWKIRGTRLGEQKIRLGLSAGMYSVNWNNFYQDINEYRTDTLISQQTGQAYYIDSTRRRNLYYEQSASVLNLHADYLVYLNPGNKLSIYTGAGARFGVSLNNSVRSTYYEFSTITNPMNGFETSSNNTNNDNPFISESKKLSVTTNLQAHAILGANYQLSKRNKFLRRISLFHEFNFGAQLNAMQEIETSLGFNVGFQTGAKISLHKRPKHSAKKKNTSRRRY